MIFTFRNHGLLVDDKLEQLTGHDFVFSQLYIAQRDWQHKESKRFSLSEEENPHIMFTMKKFKPADTQGTFSNLKILSAVYERTQGFLTPFYELEYKTKTPEEIEKVKAECKKGFFVPLNIKDGDFRPENLFFAVMITDESDKLQKRCRAAGTVNFSNIIGLFEKNEDATAEAKEIKEWESFEVKMSPIKDMNFTAIEIINRSLGEGFGGGGQKYINVMFKAKMIPSSALNDNDSVLDRVKIPSLLSPKVNEISLSIEKAKIKGPVFLGDFFGVSIEVEVIDAEGKSVACVKNVDGSEVDVYRTLISPSNEKCDWREQLRLDLLVQTRKGIDGLKKSLEETKTGKENWKDFHLRFNIFKVAENAKKKQFGFSFLPLFSSGNIVNDETHQLFVFQLDGKKDYIPNPGEYLQKEHVYDAQAPNAALKKQKGQNFNPGTGSFLDVKTRVASTMITEDFNINALLNLDAEQAFDDQISDIFDQFINNPSQDSQAKRILFMVELLEKLWSVLPSRPSQKNRIFESFIETIRPIVMVQKDFGYAAKHLDEYLTHKFKSKEVYSAFIDAFSEFIKDKARTLSQKANYTMMSLKYIFQIIAQSYKLNKKSNPNFESDEFLDMMTLLRDFLLEKDRGKPVSSKKYGFKTLFEVETINTVTEILPAKDLIDILEALLADTRDKKDQETLTLTVMSKVIKSNLFNDPESQERLYRIALDLGIHQLKREERHKSVGAKSQTKDSAFKEKTLELLKDLYEACRKPGPGEDARRDFVKEIIVEVLPRLTLLLPVKDFFKKEREPSGKEGRKKRERTEKKLDEIMFFTLLSEVDEELFDRIYEQGDSSPVFERMFRLAIQSDDFSFPEDSFELQLRSLQFFTKFLGYVSAKGIMDVTKGNYDLVELFIEATSSLITSPNLALEKFTKGKRARVQDMFGDLRKDLAQIMKNTILGISKNDILELIEKDILTDDCLTLEALFSAITKTQEVDDSQSVGGEEAQDERNCLIKVVFEILKAVFFSKRDKVKINGDLSFCYTWFISQIIGTKSEKEIFNLRDSFFQKINNHLKDFEASWESQADLAEVGEGDVHKFVTKSKVWIKHLHELTTSTRDVKKAQSRQNTKSKKSQQYYFGEITSLYYKYKVLDVVKNEATEEKLIEEGDTNFEDECIVVLQSLYNIFDRHCLQHDRDEGNEAEDDIPDDYISAGFTLDELAKLIGWSEEKCSKQMEMWIREVAEKNFADKDKGKDKDKDKVLEKIRKAKITWSEAKEAITALAIKKFTDAAGFECSVEMMEASILRYKTEVFDFRELANAYRNLATIYEYRVDFDEKLEKEEAAKKKELENARRNIINPTYFNIGFYNTSTHMRFLEGKSFIYRADAMVKPVDMWKMLELWFPFATIEKERIKEDQKKSFDGNKMVVECFLVSP